MTEKCNPNCAHFPSCSYEKNTQDYILDKDGVKHSTVIPICMLDDHEIKKWEDCKNYIHNIPTKDSVKEKIIILLGKSSAGKDYILNYLKDEYNFNPVVSHTTRPIRENEKDGKDYYFVNKTVFSKMEKNNQFIETRTYKTKFHNHPDTWFYGISKLEFATKSNKICVVDIQGYEKIIQYYGKSNIISIFIDVEDEIRCDRAKKRGSFSQTEWERRLKDDNIKFRKMVDIDYIIKNNYSKEYFQEEIVKILMEEKLI